MDLLILKHLRYLGDSRSSDLKQLVDVTIDFIRDYSCWALITKPYSFTPITSQMKGVLSAHQVIGPAGIGSVVDLYQVNPLEYVLAETGEESMRTGQLKTVELEYLEFVKFSLLDAGRFEVDGPLVRYLYGKS